MSGWFAGQDSAVGEGEGGAAGVGVEVDVPVVFVDEVVVSLAEQEQVVELCFAVASPPLDVVRVGPCFLAVAAGEPAAAIADRDCFPQPGWDAVVAASVVEDFAGTGPQHAVHHAVAEECVGRPAVEDPPVRGDRTSAQPKMLRPITVTAAAVAVVAVAEVVEWLTGAVVRGVLLTGTACVAGAVGVARVAEAGVWFEFDDEFDVGVVSGCGVGVVVVVEEPEDLDDRPNSPPLAGASSPNPP